nr:transposase [Streptomyces sp. alain-838]
MREQGARLCFADESGQGLCPPKARTWSPKGTTAVVKVTGRGGGRVSLTSAVCCRPGEHTRLVYRIPVRRPGRRGEKKGFREPDLAAFQDAVHQELGGRPIVLV